MESTTYNLQTLQDGTIDQIVREISGNLIVNMRWFDHHHPLLVKTILIDLGFEHRFLRIDGKVYRAYVNRQCHHPKHELDIHLRASTWEKAK